MIKWRLSDEPIAEDESEDYRDEEVRKNTRCSIFLGYTSNMASCGMREYIRYHGACSLAPKRSEPMKFGMMRAINGVANVIHAHDEGGRGFPEEYMDWMALQYEL